MQVINGDEVDISGFAGVRERVFVMDAGWFGAARPGHAADGTGALVYLADAHMRPGGQTGMHAHQDVTIVTLMTRGQILHRGDLGDRTLLEAGQVQVQHCGGGRFQHNEINPGEGINRFIQLWFDARQATGPARLETMSVAAEGRTLLYSDAGTRCHVYTSGVTAPVPFSIRGLVYVVSGSCSVQEAGQPRLALHRGTLCQGQAMTVQLQPDSQLLAVCQDDG